VNILITGGAGFVGSNLALSFRRQHPTARIVAFDNLKRRGAELNLSVFREQRIEFAHGDIRQRSDLDDLEGEFDVLIEASAEPSVLAGLSGSPQYLLQTNLAGTLNCLEFARKRAGSFIFLSTSRVYSMRPLKEINLEEGPSRFKIALDQKWSGVTSQGIAEEFPVHLPRSLYGATKLASEIIIQEYVELYGMRALINRCGVIAGPGQFGKVDQGVFTLWVAQHFFRKPLKYTGFGGGGKQVRDLLHPSDLFELISKQLERLDDCNGEIYNVGGGPAVSTSLCELTALCQEMVGHRVPISSETHTSSVDIPLYLSDYSKAARAFDWQPTRSMSDIVGDILQWLRTNEATLKQIFT
jgi:CDP-paratose 2-epimerase